MTDPRIEAVVEVLKRITNPATACPASTITQWVTEILAAADAAAWRPIATAPKDETCILVPYKHVGCVVVSFWGAGWRETTNGLMLRDEPTHWQPLPAPPGDEVKA